MAPIQHFKNVFWSQKQPELTLPDFSTGYSILHQKLGQSKIENEEMIYFFKDRIAIEESYANKLSEQSSFKSSGFGRDEGAGLFKCFSQLKETSRRIGEQHKVTAAAVSQHVLAPLQDFHEEYKRNISHSKQAVDSMLKQFDGLVKEVEKSKSVYHRKCKEADKAEELALKNAAVITEKELSTISATTTLPSPACSTTTQEENTPPTSEDGGNVAPPPPTATTKIQLGNQIMLQSELDSLVRRMRQEITTKDHRVPILGTYKNTSTGEGIAIWLQHNLPQCKDSPAMADVVGQQLIQPYNMLRLVGQRGNKFISSSNSFYQWRISDDDEATFAALGGLMDKITTTTPPTPATMEEAHKRARREAEKCDQVYRSAVQKLDQMRMAIEEAMFAHFTEMEQVELQRIQQLKELISSFIASLSVAIPQDKLVIEEMMVFQESLKPDQDIQYIIQQYAVSGFAPKAILYDNYYHGISHDQVFGVPLEELGKQTHDVPRIIGLLLLAIEKGAEKIEDKQAKERLWSTPVALDRVHATCLELNVGSDALTLEMIEKHDAELLVAVLRYFLLELPECLMTFEFYDPVEALLGGAHDDQGESLRIASFSNLIATLPGSHFVTLKAIFENITSFTAKVQASNDTLHNVCQSLGPVILRARVDSFSILNSKVPVRFVHELMKYSKEIFSESTLKLHAESEKRRHARPIIAPTTPQDESTINKSKRANSLMSFMRPTINTAEELNKWTVNSMKGVFQRNNNQSPTTTTETQQHTPKSVPLSFGSTIITQQESPPSSPVLSSAPNSLLNKIVEESKVMFDGDHIFDDEPDEGIKEEGSLVTDTTNRQEEEEEGQKQDTQPTITAKQEGSRQPALPAEHIDSSFFDDDEDDD